MAEHLSTSASWSLKRQETFEQLRQARNEANRNLHLQLSRDLTEAQALTKAPEERDAQAQSDAAVARAAAAEAHQEALDAHLQGVQAGENLAGAHAALVVASNEYAERKAEFHAVINDLDTIFLQFQNEETGLSTVRPPTRDLPPHDPAVNAFMRSGQKLVSARSAVKDAELAAGTAASNAARTRSEHDFLMRCARRAASFACRTRSDLSDWARRSETACRQIRLQLSHLEKHVTIQQAEDEEYENDLKDVQGSHSPAHCHTDDDAAAALACAELCGSRLTITGKRLRSDDGKTGGCVFPLSAITGKRHCGDAGKAIRMPPMKKSQTGPGHFDSEKTMDQKETQQSDDEGDLDEDDEDDGEGDDDDSEGPRMCSRETRASMEC